MCVCVGFFVVFFYLTARRQEKRLEKKDELIKDSILLEIVYTYNESTA